MKSSTPCARRACLSPCSTSPPTAWVALVEAIAARWPQCLLAVFATFPEVRVAAARRAGGCACAVARQRQCGKGRILSGVDLSPLPAPQASEPVSGSAVALMAECLYAGGTLEEASAAAKAAGFARNEVYRAGLFLRPLERDSACAVLDGSHPPQMLPVQAMRICRHRIGGFPWA